ncbi:Fe-S cluster assembly protein SufD [Demequina activiva]|uniref:Fe-S cluster assembly protein SufD n=1 Tax=Demequina activiva TaxID=1582364 RepID=A0A919UK09_9MICO|nr:Fe-S cluster assembly protein SufD [Demequina activiva]GIG54415.1 Fe-S cluster assembly protein SufD [Demequina activiva]
MTTTDHSQATADAAHTDGVVVPQGSRGERFTSFDVDAFEQPGPRDEDYRFSALRDLAPVLDEAAAPADGASVEVTAPQGVVVGELAQGEAPRGTVLVPEDRIAAIASAGTERATHVAIPADAQLTDPIRVAITGRERSRSHLVIEAGTHSEATVILEHRGTGAHAGNVEVIMGDGSQLKVVSLQQWDDDAVHAGTHHARVGRDATYKHVAVSLGGKAVRLAVTAEYGGTGGSAELLGLYYSDAGQHLEHRTFIDHNAPQCHSNVAYKGALAGKTARTVWIGDVLIRAAAEGTDTYELNRNLVLTDGARADSVPNLEIETGEIEGAGHASATGRFDDEQMFYLRSRGIPEDRARKLVVRGFFADLIQQIGVPEVEAGLMQEIDKELEHFSEEPA